MKHPYIIMAAMLLLNIPAMAQKSTLKYDDGDVNGDGKVDVADIASIISIMAGDYDKEDEDTIPEVVTGKHLICDFHLQDHVVGTYWYGTNGRQAGLGYDEVHAYVYAPQAKLNVGADIDWQGTSYDYSILSGVQAWKPVELQIKLSNLFLGNLYPTPHEWITYKYVDDGGNEVSADGTDDTFDVTKLALDFVFDASNNNARYRGDLKTQKGAEIILHVNEYPYTITFNRADGSREQRTFKPGRVLLARPAVNNINIPDSIRSDFETDLQLVAYLDPATESVLNYYDYEDIASRYYVKLNNSVVTNQNDTYAKALLGYCSPNQLTDDGLSAKIALQPVDADMACINNTFDVRFIRPITISGDLSAQIAPATGSTMVSSVNIYYKLASLRFKDFRNTWAPMTKIPDYDKYFAPDGESMIVADIDGLTTGMHLEDNIGVLTDMAYATSDYRYNNLNYGVPLYTVSNSANFVLTEYDRNNLSIILEYRNDGNVTGTFHVWVPVKIEHYWGTIYDYLTITVKSATGY